jgi:hypothetical protein
VDPMNTYTWIALVAVLWCGIACMAGLFMGPFIAFGTQPRADTALEPYFSPNGSYGFAPVETRTLFVSR